MKKLIKAKTTGAFLTPDGTWTADITQAGEFPSPEATGAAPAKLNYNDFECYYAFGENTVSHYDFSTGLDLGYSCGK